LIFVYISLNNTASNTELNPCNCHSTVDLWTWAAMPLRHGGACLPRFQGRLCRSCICV